MFPRADRIHVLENEEEGSGIQRHNLVFALEQ